MTPASAGKTSVRGLGTLCCVITLLVQLSMLSVAQGAAAGWQEVGVRTGIQATPKHEHFNLYQAFGVYGLPWEWRSSSGWGVATEIVLAGGALTGGGETGFMGSAGPGVSFGRGDRGIAVEAGGDLDLLQRRHYRKQDFGSILLWGAYAGASYRFDSGIGLGYRFQHWSNNRIIYPDNPPNPGLDMHLISVSWNF